MTTGYPATDRPIQQNRWQRFKKRRLRPLLVSLTAALLILLLWRPWERPETTLNTVRALSFKRNRIGIHFKPETMLAPLSWGSGSTDSTWQLLLHPAHQYFPVSRRYTGLDLRTMHLTRQSGDTLLLSLKFSKLSDTPQVTFDSTHHCLRVHFNRQLDTMQVVVLDPGHGGHNAGAIGQNGLLEKDVNLDIVKRIEKKLKKQGGIKVVLTRHDDRFIPLSRRRNLSNQWGADLFLSIHGNSASNHRVDMPEVYYLGRRHTASAQRFLNAMKAVVPSDTGFIRQRGYAVLRGNWARSGAYLLETLYLSNPRGERLLGQPAMREALAGAIAQATLTTLQLDGSGVQQP